MRNKINFLSQIIKKIFSFKLNIPEELQYDVKRVKFFFIFIAVMIRKSNFQFIMTLNIKYLTEMRIFLVDRTFIFCPNLILSNFPFPYEIFRQELPYIYTLISKKNNETYNMCFYEIIEGFEFITSCFIAGFKRDLKNGLSNCFYNSKLFKFLFQFKQIIAGKIEELVLIVIYIRHKNFNTFFGKKILDLSFFLLIEKKKSIKEVIFQY